MRKLLIVTAITFFTGVSFAQTTTVQPVKKVNVSGSVINVGAYCGGAYPGEEQIAEIKKPRPFPLKKLYLKQGKWNDFSKPVILEFMSDAAGNFSISVVPGTYCVIDERKINRSSYNAILKEYGKASENNTAVDKECLAKWFQTPDAVLVVGQDGLKNTTITFYEKCSWESTPCIEYHGSLPP